MKEHLVRLNSVASSSVDEPTDLIELRSRAGRNQSIVNNSANTQRNDNASPTWLGSRVLIDREVKHGDTLNKIALQYSVPVSDLKRANTIVNDQEIYALPNIKIPVSRFFADRLEAENGSQVAPYRHHASKSAAPGTNDDRRPLLDTDDDEESDEMNRRAKVGALLQRTDANVAQVRGNLPSPGIETGAFHFVDASSPDSTMRNIWLLIFAVLFIFVFLPLMLTLLEEKSEMEAEQKHHHSPNTQPSSL
jgi:LysM repeat protein